MQNEQNQAQIAAARQKAQALQSQLDSANLNLHETAIHAPFDGIITNKCRGAMILSSLTGRSRAFTVKPTSKRGDVDIIAFNLKVRKFA